MFVWSLIIMAILLIAGLFDFGGITEAVGLVMQNLFIAFFIGLLGLLMVFLVWFFRSSKHPG